jgi:sulfate adenylyltransferase subunit 1
MLCYSKSGALESRTEGRFDARPEFESHFEATICWMDHKTFQPGQKLILQQNSFRTKAVIKSLEGKVIIHTGKIESTDDALELNEFGQVVLKTTEPVAFDKYAKNRRTRAFILIHEITNNTVAAGVIH